MFYKKKFYKTFYKNSIKRSIKNYECMIYGKNICSFHNDFSVTPRKNYFFSYMYDQIILICIDFFDKNLHVLL